MFEEHLDEVELNFDESEYSNDNFMLEEHLHPGELI